MKPWPPSLLHLGTCSWTAEGWAGTFYKKITQSNAYLVEYAEHFNAVEIDASFYGVPRRETIERWRDITPEGFTFAAKVPQIITHLKCMDNCTAELEEFLTAMDLLGPRLGPLLFQFPYFAQRRAFPFEEFLKRLDAMLESLPRGHFQYAVEVRNKAWLCQSLLDLLRRHNVALALIDHPWMPSADALFRNHDLVTGPFVYLRLLGDRKGIEQITQVWNKTVVDRRNDLQIWAGHMRSILERGVPVYGFVNNHYSGYAAADVEILLNLLNEDPGTTVETASS